MDLFIPSQLKIVIVENSKMKLNQNSLSEAKSGRIGPFSSQPP